MSERTALSVSYEIKLVHDLPSVDLAKTVGSPFLTSARHSALIQWSGRHMTHLSWANRFALVCMIGAFLLPRHIGNLLCYPAFLLSLPSFLVSMAVTNTQLLKLLLREYEFWLFTAMNTTVWGLLGKMLGGTRGIAPIAGWFGTELVIISDSNIRSLPLLLRGALIWIPGTVSLAVICWARLFDVNSSAYSSFVAAHRMVFTPINLMLNTGITLCVYVVRRCYSKRIVFSNAFEVDRLVPCGVIHARLHLQQVGHPLEQSRYPADTDRIAPHAAMVNEDNSSRRIHWFRTDHCNIRTVPVTKIAPSPVISPLIQQLQLAPLRFTHVHSHHVIFDVISSCSTPLGRVQTLLLYGIGLTGLALTGYGVFLSPEKHELHYQLVSPVALAATTIFVAPFALSYQRYLLRALVWNFDVAFLSLQVTAYIAGLAFIVRDRRCLVMFSLHLWFHFALLVDALTPAVKTHFRFRKVFTAPGMLLYNVMGLWIGYGTFVRAVPFFHDQPVVCVDMFGSSHCILTTSFVIHRMATTLLWSVRMVWEICVGHENELVFFRGNVRFFCPLEINFHRGSTAQVLNLPPADQSASH